MVRKSSLVLHAAATLALAGTVALSPFAAFAQSTPRITASIDGSPLVALPHSVHPWASPQFDRGRVPDSLQGRMLLVLHKTPEQEAELQSLLAQQQDPASPNFHKWLTPEQFGQRFGVGDSDLQTVNGYLASQGMTVGRVYSNRGAIEVSATAGQIRNSFHTEIHSYVIGGRTFHANSTAPKIPAALSGLVGIVSLNNFSAGQGIDNSRQGTLDAATHTLHPQYTTQDGNGNNVYGVSPGDLALIYDIPTAAQQGAGGANINIGILGDSNINLNYIKNYRAIFGLPAATPIVVVDGNDPGINGDAYIGYKQVELVSAVAPNANIYYYTSRDTDWDYGLNFAILRAVADNQVQVLLNGYQKCESTLAAEPDNLPFHDFISEEAAAQGMTYIVATGNSGDAACDPPGITGSAAQGSAVNGYASSPFVTAVGGTDFYYGTNNTGATYWNNTKATTPYTSAKGHITEQVWNDSNPNAPDAEVVGTDQPSVLMAGGGGMSTVGLDGNNPWPLPSYQSGLPYVKNNAGKATAATGRMLPDVSFFAGSGANNALGYNDASYLFCMQAADCQPGGNVQFTYSGGTEAASAVFAGAVALAANKLGVGSAAYGLGNINPSLYSILSKATPVVKNYDVTKGDNRVECSGGPNCQNGLMIGYAAGTGYDPASGWGSLDIGTFVSNFSNVTTGATTPTVALTLTNAATNLPPTCGTAPNIVANCTVHSTEINFTVNVAGTALKAAPTGDVAIYTTSPYADEQAFTMLTLTPPKAGVVSTANTVLPMLPGGTYSLYARYVGDSTYAAATSATQTLTVQQETPAACSLEVYLNTQNSPPLSLPYGQLDAITLRPRSQLYGGYIGIASGAILVNDTYNGSTNTITSLPLSSEGTATFITNLLGFGQHSIHFVYPGDASFQSCSTGVYTVNVTSAPTTLALNPSAPDATQGNVLITASVQPQTMIVSGKPIPSNGIAPTGSVTFTTSSRTVSVPLTSAFDASGNAIASASLQLTSADAGTLTATYVPTGSNYKASSNTANVADSSSILFTNYSSTTTFTISDSLGISNNNQAGPYPSTDALTLNIQVATPGNQPNGACVYIIVPFCSSTPYVSVYANGIPLTTNLQVDQNGNAIYTLPQQNGYLNLGSNHVNLTVDYSGYSFTFIGDDYQVNSSSASQQIAINSDSTSADFSLQSDTTVNAATPLSASNGSTSYGLRISSIYNFANSAFASTPINLTCAVVSYTSPLGISSTSGIRTTFGAGANASPLACSFNQASVNFANNSIATGFIPLTLTVQAASGATISSTTVQPANRWWMAAGGTTLACLFLLGLPARRRKWQSMLGACVLMVAGFSITGCGATTATSTSQQSTGSANGSGSSTGTTTPAVTSTNATPGTYTVVVTATSQTNTTLIHTLPVQVIVN